MNFAISITNLCKVYDNGFSALDTINLNVKKGEVFALLGPNGAGKTSLINIICGIVNATSGNVKILDYDILKNYRQARYHIGLVPQELSTDTFETVWNTVCFSRKLFGKAKNHKFIEQTLKQLSLWDKKDQQIRTLSGGMKRRVLIAKALSHEPKILFLDEPTAGVDINLRKSMWVLVRKLKEQGVTIILTTHYIEEAEDMADRVGIINKGKIILVEDKTTLMKKLGKKEVIIHLNKPLINIPPQLKNSNISLQNNGNTLCFTYDPNKKNNEVINFLDKLKQNNIFFHDIDIKQSSLEEIFVNLIGQE